MLIVLQIIVFFMLVHTIIRGTLTQLMKKSSEDRSL